MSKMQRRIVLVLAFAAMTTTVAGAQGNRAIPDFIWSRQTQWFVYFLIWGFLHYGLGIAGLICSVIVGGVDFAEANKKRRIVLTVIAASATGLITFLTPVVNARTYQQAWRMLDAGTRQYQIDPNMTLMELNKIVDEGERHIGSNVIGF